MLELRQQPPFVEDGVDGLFGDDARFGHFFHGVHSFELFSLDLPHFAEPALPNHTVKLERRLVDFCKR